MTITQETDTSCQGSGVPLVIRIVNHQIAIYRQTGNNQVTIVLRLNRCLGHGAMMRKEPLGEVLAAFDAFKSG